MLNSENLQLCFQTKATHFLSHVKGRCHDIDNKGCRVHPIYHSIKRGTKKQKVNLEKVRKQVAQTIFRLNEYARKTFL